MEKEEKKNEGEVCDLDVNKDDSSLQAEEEQYFQRREERRKKLRKKRRRARIKSAIVVTAVVLLAGCGVGIAVQGMDGFVNSVTSVTDSMVASIKKLNIENNGTLKKSDEEATDNATAEVSGEVADETLDGDSNDAVSGEKSADNEVDNEAASEEAEQQTEDAAEDEQTEEAAAQPDERETAVLDQANLLAAQYDYDKAIELLKSDRSYNTSQEMQAAVKQYEETKASCVSWPIEEVTHIFYHSLIKDTSKAFDGDYKAGDYNQVMTTIDEFNKITQEMYDRGYVMVSIYDMATVNEDGTMTRGEILLPEGKIPFVLSQDDVSYYHYMDGDGYASKLIVDEDGKVRNEYIEDDGSISVGDYDMVPLIDRFVEEHPDFSYRGAKGIIALTGYNGILGYRTDISYETRPADLDQNKVDWLNAHPDFDLETERAEAKKVADAMKANGWLFASHTWGHKNVAERSLEALQTDTQLFKENVDPIIGGTDIIIFAFGVDLSDYADYSGEKFDYFKSQGYNYFCNVDSSQYFVQLRDTYLRQGRRNVDGYRMYYNPDMLDDLFDVSSVFDASRPVPVPQM